MVKFVESKKKENDWIKMASKEINKLDKELEDFAKGKGFGVTFTCDDGETKLSFYATEKPEESLAQKVMLPPEAVELIGKIAKLSKSDVLLTDVKTPSQEIMIELGSSPMCADTEESYESLCDYCDMVRGLI